MAEVIDELIVRISGDASDLESTINSVSGELSKLDRQQNGNNLSKSAGKVAESWQKAGKSIKDFGEGFDKATKPLQNAAVALSVGGVAAAKFAVDFENNFANVKKTVDGTPEQLEKIRQEIIDMSTVGINGHSAIPQTTAELTELAAAGGQLGIETERIAGFTETMAMLGTATNLSGEEGAATLAKFANVTKMSQENFDRLGSSIVDLGNNFATTESDIANMSMRLAGAGTQVGLNQADILGIATALSSVGIEAEMGGSAFSKAMIAMQMASSTGYTQINEVLGKTGMSLRDLQLMSANNSKDFKALADNLGYTSTELTSMMNSGVQLENFAKITGKTTEEFKNLFDSSPAEAIDAFIKGLQNSDSTGESAIEMLQEMGFTEVRLRDSLLRLANSEAGVTEAVTRSNQAWEENTALQNEFNAKAETTASQLAVTKNNFIEAGRSIGETMLPTIKDVSAGIAGFAQKLASMDDSAKKTLVNTASGVIALGIASKGIAGTIKNVGGVVEGIGTMQKALSAGGTLAKFAPALASIGSVVGPAALGVAGITTAVVAGSNAGTEGDRPQSE
ncbi:MAG: phage tail tape measure protein, partial [Eubacterium sp.]|nr:phage tail tape measure protein [Eubacterium sp.]